MLDSVSVPAFLLGRDSVVIRSASVDNVSSFQLSLYNSTLSSHIYTHAILQVTDI
jgi:hypothetical protein